MDGKMLEQLAYAQAVYKAVATAVDTKNPASLRRQLDAQAKEEWETDHIKSRQVYVNGENVGSYSVTTSKPTEERVVQSLHIANMGALKAAIMDEEPDTLRDFVSEHVEDFATWVMQEYGELLDGCAVVDEVIPAQPERYKNTTLRIYPEKVAHAMGDALPSTIVGLLEGGL